MLWRKLVVANHRTNQLVQQVHADEPVVVPDEDADKLGGIEKEEHLELPQGSAHISLHDRQPRRVYLVLNEPVYFKVEVFDSHYQHHCGTLQERAFNLIDKILPLRFSVKAVQDKMLPLMRVSFSMNAKFPIYNQPVTFNIENPLMIERRMALVTGRKSNHDGHSHGSNSLFGETGA